MILVETPSPLPICRCVLVCTDALARGIDMQQPVDAVVQLAPAQDGVLHLHRIGRTARAGQAGVTVTIASTDEACGDLSRVEMARRAMMASGSATGAADVAWGKRLLSQPAVVIHA